MKIAENQHIITVFLRLIGRIAMPCTFVALLFAAGLSAQQPLPSDPGAGIEETTPMEDVDTPEIDEPGGDLTEPYAVPLEKTVAMREIDGEKWREASKNLDYSKDVVEKEPTPEEQSLPSFDSSGWNNATAFFGKILQVLAVILTLAAIAFWIYKMMQAPKNRQIAQDGTVITTDNLEAYIHETDLDRFLKAALAEGNYSLAIRLYYLQIIKSLSEKNAIKWSREKTNRDYQREMKDHRLGREFRDVTRTFERVWYGNQGMDATGYAALEPTFKGLLNQI